jgi:fatty-acyl-CoA synthase
MNIGRAALSQRSGSDDWPALSLEDDGTMTYGEVRQRRDRYAAGLRAAGVGPGDRVGLLLYNSLEYWPAYLAVAAIGAICVRLNFRLTGPELRHALVDAECETLIVHDGLTSVVATVLDQTPLRRTYVVDRDGHPVPGWARPAEELAVHGRVEPAPVEPNTPVMIMYTSGTTGQPKGAVWTHRTTTMFGLMQVLQWGYDPTRVAMTTGPLYHVGSMEDLLLPALMSGGHAVITRSGQFSVERALGVMQRRRVTDVLLFPAMIYEMVDSGLTGRFDLSALRTIVTGGSPLLPWAVQELHRVLPEVALYPVYGLTEGGGISTVLEPDELRQHPDGAGRPMPLVELRLVGENGTSCPPGAVGEICVRGPNVAAGYWRRPAETAETFVDGWLHTGDLGRLTEDGLLFVTGRKKDMIRTGDENVYAAEVEGVIASHPEVIEAAVIGIPDRQYGEAVCAVVVSRPGATLTAEAVVEFCRTRLAGYKKPRHVIFVDVLPRNVTGKVTKIKLRADLAHLARPIDDRNSRGGEPMTAQPAGRFSNPGPRDAQLLLDRLDLQDLLARYARGVDRRDWDLVRDCYHPDAWDSHGAYAGGVDGLIDWLRERHRGVSRSMHIITNVLVEFAGPDLAVSEAYSITTQHVTDVDGPALRMYRVDPATAGVPGAIWETEVRCRFVDRVERRAQRWRIAHRTVVFEMLRARPVPPGEPFGPDWAVGTRDEYDPLYRTWNDVSRGKQRDERG